VSGQTVRDDRGAFYLVDQSYPLDHQHGGEPLGLALKHPQELFARFTGDPSLSQLDLRRAAFIDTETTGLAGGTGTYAFLVGIGYFDGDCFRLRQFFMRDYSEEATLLHYLAVTMDDLEGIVSFNGRGFDLPLLETRFLLSRLRPDLLDAPHLDLLSPARRLWRARLASCALSSLEQNVLKVHRDERDVPGFLIPHMYFRYLQTGDASEISRVFYHNAQDVLSLVTLASHMGSLFQAPALGLPANELDLLSLGRLCERIGLHLESEEIYRRILRLSLPPEVQAIVQERLSFICKRTGRWDEAVSLWGKLLASGQAHVTPHVELAKYYEHRARDPERALELALQARGVLVARPNDPGYNRVLSALDHRIGRLRRKVRRPRR
jgi:uncharacterized protein YprB with RNaseH-like and TPR domain